MEVNTMNNSAVECVWSDADVALALAVATLDVDSASPGYRSAVESSDESEVL